MLEAYAEFLRAARAGAGLRRLRAFSLAELPGRVILQGRELVNFSSNDYLGLSRHPLLAEMARDFAEIYGSGSTASRLICGTSPAHERVESELASLKGAESALIFASGYQANASLIPALLDRAVLGCEPLVFADRLNHASMHAGIKAAGARQIRYRHLDLNHLEGLLRKHAASPVPRFILSESVFSMDGDQVDVAGLIALAERFGAFLYLDEAHAAGVFGSRGMGLAEGKPIARGLIMGTFSKGLGSFGAYAACASDLREYLINRCAGFIFSTAPPPSLAGAMLAGLKLVPEMRAEREHLAGLGAWLRQALQAQGLDIALSSTQIVPVICGASQTALELSARLEADGFLAVAIRPPTVPEGAARIRLSLSAAHSREDVENLERSIFKHCRELKLC